MDIRGNIGRITLAGCLLLFGFGWSIADAQAAVLICNNCDINARKNVARAAGSGTHLVADYTLKTVSGFGVEYDRERRIWMVLPAAVPQQVRDSFAFHVSPAMASAGGVVFVGPNRPNNPFPFPGGFNGLNAYDIVGSATLRGRLEQQIASQFAGATTSSTVWNDTAFSLTSLTLGFLGAFVGDSVTIVVAWPDGSETVLKIESGSTHRAAYQPGQSVDQHGNRIPDSAATGPGGAGYTGDYHFQGDPNGLQDWLNSARMMGIPITGPSSGGSRIDCTWDGITLRCHVY
jgi:hypothetical protein